MEGFLTDGPEDAERRLAGLVREHLLPVAHDVVTRRFGWRPERTSSSNEEDEDREDVVADALAAVLSVLRGMRTAWTALPETSRPAPIADLRAYTYRAAESAFSRYLRVRHPGRWKANTRIGYVCKCGIGFSTKSSPQGLVLVRDDWGAVLPGADPNRAQRIALDPNAARTAAERELGRHASNVPEFLALFLDWVGGPVSVPVLAGALSHLLALDQTRATFSSAQEEGEEEFDAPDSKPDLDRIVRAREELAALWAGIRKLNVRHRNAILLNLRGGGRISVISLFPIVGVATIEEIAETLEMPYETFLELWPRLPISDAEIGEILGRTAKQVFGFRGTGRLALEEYRPDR